MNPGELRHKIIIQKISSIQDDYGQPSEQPEEVLKTRANIRPIVGKQFFEADIINHSITHKIRMRYNSKVKPEMQVVYMGRIFDILSVINYQERNVELQLMCKELI